MKTCPQCGREWFINPGSMNYCAVGYAQCLMPEIMEKQMPDRDPLLNERGKTHGSFEVNSRVSRDLKLVIQAELVNRAKRGDTVLTHQQTEALDMICHKIGRIVAGNSHFRDHWDDIAGYAKLASEACTEEK